MNERRLAHVERIDWIRPIDGADNIELCGVLGWQCVIAKKDNFKVGDYKLRRKTRRKPDEERVNRNRIRKGAEWKEWRESVFKRDDYTCKHCGARSSAGAIIELHPHHIKPYALFPDLRFDVSNGITLCKKCHKQEHKEGESFKIYGNIRCQKRFSTRYSQ